MTTRTKTELVWQLGLSRDELTGVKDALGREIKYLDIARALKLRAENDDKIQEPLLILISQERWAELDLAVQDQIMELESPQKVMVVDRDRPGAVYEQILSQGFSSVLTRPLTPEKLSGILNQAHEIKSLYEDILRMAGEIELEREILTRKTENLMFLNRVLTNAAETLDPGSILHRAGADLKMLIEVDALQAVFWKDEKEGRVEACLYLNYFVKPPAQEQWIEYMLESAEKLSGKKVTNYNLAFFQGPGSPEAEDKVPHPGETVLLPFKAGGETFGCLVLTSPNISKMGKERIQTLRAAVSHLALALRNALLFRTVKARADHDGLTRVFTRQYFDDRIAEELKRHQRYHHDISLLMIDIDHFKEINDTHGHQAGDMVLKEMGRVLLDTLRGTDFPARYGGEEFVVILPHTTEEQAWSLAERLRRRVAKKRFSWHGKTFRVTVSIGAASLKPGALHKQTDLVRQADKALYLAKANGRNLVCVSAEGGENESSPARPPASDSAAAPEIWPPAGQS